MLVEHRLHEGRDVREERQVPSLVEALERREGAVDPEDVAAELRRGRGVGLRPFAAETGKRKGRAAK